MIIGIIGSTGFLGTNLMNYFNKMKYFFDENHVVGCSRRTGVDATNLDSLYDFINANKITHLINLAAHCGGIGLNKKQPFDLWLESTLISANVLKIASMMNVKKVVMIGTVCSYAAKTPVPFKEEYLMNYGDPEETNRAYGLSKLNSLYGAKAAKKQYGIDVVNLIPVNMYGEYDNFDPDSSHVIPAIINKIHLAKIKNITPSFWGDGTATREFLYVGDCCDAIFNALMKIEDDEFYNIGSGKEISISGLINMISQKMGYDGPILYNTSMPNGQMRRCLDISKLKDKINWQAQVSLSDGLDRTIDWFNTVKTH